MQVDITPEAYNLIKMMQAMKFGEITIMVKGGKPVRVEKAVKSIQLDNEAEVDIGLETLSL